MAYEYGIKDLWIVNVGDIRPQELPLSYYMALAYDYEGMGINHPNETDDFIRGWVEEQFGGVVEDDDVKEEIVSVLKAYTRMHGNRRPEVTYPDTYHVTHYGESSKMIHLCHRIKKMADDIDGKLPEEAKASYYGLVYYPAVAGGKCSVDESVCGEESILCEVWCGGEQMIMRKKVKQCITYDEELTNYYNKEMADGKWDGMMLSAHIGFTHWNDEDWKYPETVQGAVSDENKSLVHANRFRLLCIGRGGFSS